MTYQLWGMKEVAETLGLPTFCDPDWLTNPGTRREIAFAAFHRDNPQVYDELAELARPLYDRGQPRIGIGMLYEVARYSHMLRTEGRDGFKLNNNHRALYARLFVHNNPEYDDVIERRTTHDGSGL